MTAYDWMMTVGLLAIIAVAVKGFWRSNRIEPTERPNTPPSDYDSHWNN
jgi:FtsZ-interacting cell division protein ZipA